MRRRRSGQNDAGDLLPAPVTPAAWTGALHGPAAAAARTHRYAPVYANVEGAEAAREDKEEAMRTILDELASRARSTLHDAFLDEHWPASDRNLIPRRSRWISAKINGIAVDFTSNCR